MAEAHDRSVVVKFTFQNPCRVSMIRAAFSVRGDTIALVPFFPHALSPVCPDEFVLDAYEAVISPLAVGDYKVAIYGESGGMSFYPIRHRVGSGRS